LLELSDQDYSFTYISATPICVLVPPSSSDPATSGTATNPWTSASATPTDP